MTPQIPFLRGEVNEDKDANERREKREGERRNEEGLGYTTSYQAFHCVPEGYDYRQ
jgi:hypothetical protein